MKNIAVYVAESPIEDMEFTIFAICPVYYPDKEGKRRLRFIFPGDPGPVGGTWGLYGNVIKDGTEAFTFSAKGNGIRDGIYEFKLLTIRDFRNKYKGEVERGDWIAEACHTSDDLWEWYRRNWGRHTFDDYLDYLADERRKKGLPDPETRW
jgi:hypothetical protein